MRYILLLLLTGCASYYQASEEVRTKCTPTDLYAIQSHNLTLQVWDCDGVEIEGKVADLSRRDQG